MKKLIAKIREILRNRRVRRIWMRTVSSIAGLVVFVTTYALVLPAITMESEAACGMEAHQHDDSCYEEQLICDLPESDGHTHTEECYDDAGSLVCGLEESEGHHHDASCYEKVLICGKEVHTHSPACYREDAASTAATERAAVAVTVPGVMDENGAADDAGDTGITDNTDNTDNTGIDGTTGALEIADPTETAAEGYVPALDELDFRQLLNDSTAIYYHRAADDPETKTEAAAAEAETEHEIETEKDKENEKEPENSGQITDWQKVDEDTELGENDILRVYLAYTIPAGSLNETNPVARYRLPANLHLTDEQIDAINQTENGLSSQYVDYETLQITDPGNHSAYLGAEAVEGFRTPDQTIEEYSGSNRNDHNDRNADGNDGSEGQAAQEFISAVVKADQIYDEEGLYGEKGALLGTDLVFTFSPYMILKNRNEYDLDGKPVKAGESVSGWLALDLNMDQVDWNGNDHTTAEITFVSDSKENKELGISPISVTLHKADPTAPASEETTDEDHTDAADETHPAVSFEDSLTVHTGSLGSDITGGNGSDAAGSGAPAGPLPASSKLTVSVSAEAGTFPAGTTMVLSAVQDMDAVAEAVEGTVDSKTCGFQAVDISFRDKDGNEIEPLKPISVTMRSDSIKAATEDSSMAPVVVHVEDRDKDKEKEKAETSDRPAATVIEILPDTTGNKENTEKQFETPDAANSPDAISFESDAFSVYAIVYTVDFHWEVNGKTYDFSIPGGGFVSLQHLVEVLGIANNDANTENTQDGEKGSQGASEENSETDAGEVPVVNDVEAVNAGTDDTVNTAISANTVNTENNIYEESINLNKTAVSEKTREFVADVASVEFSSPELVWVGKVESTTTVGTLKDANSLDCQYNAELTEDQISEINSSTVDAGDWALISLLPFMSRETLTVTMKNGDQFTIQVTDAQDASAYIGKEVVIYDNAEQRAMLSGGYSYDSRYRLNSTTLQEAYANSAAHWTVERYNNNYYLKSSDNRYLTINNNDVGLANTWQSATALVIEAGWNPDYKIYDAYNHNNVLTYNTNGTWGDGYFSAPGGKNGTTAREWLYIEELKTTPSDRVGDWMLYFDDDFDEITIHVGETITLRPYNKWEWKEGNTDVQSEYWKIGGKDNSFWSQIGSGDDNGAHLAVWDDGGSGSNTAAFHWTAYVKEDTELVTHYWSVQGCATKTGDYILTNTKNDKKITVHVVDGKPVNQPDTIKKIANIKVNLFDYDRTGMLDGSWDSNTKWWKDDNLANQSNNYKNDSVNKMGGSDHFYFLSSGSGNNNNESWNSYTNSNSNPNIVQNQLGSDGYPILNHGNNTSLKYLFDKTQTNWHGGNNNDGMIAYPDVIGMFQKDSAGYYYYNSNTNYFYYDTASGTSKLYEHTYTQTSSRDKNSLVNDKPIGFFPFHDYDATDNLSVNQNHNLNHHIGLSMELEFMLPNDRKDDNGKPVIFDFSGDDDLWVFVEWKDDQGVTHSKKMLDLGGVHQPIHGQINFTDDSSIESHKPYTLKVFYLERGGCDSNCSIRFNLPIIQDLTVAKKLTGLTEAEKEKYKNEEFTYEIVVNGQLYNGPKGPEKIVVRNAAGEDITPDNFRITNGQVKIKDGETVTIYYLDRSDKFSVAEVKTPNMENFEIPNAERYYHQEHDASLYEEEIHLSADKTKAQPPTDDWVTPTYELEDTEKVTFTNTLKEKNLEVEKKWKGEKDHPDSITFTVSATVENDNNGRIPYAVSELKEEDGTTDKVFTLSNSNNWRYEIEHLPVNTPDGKFIFYDINEGQVKGYTLTGLKDITAENYNYCNVDVVKLWPDSNEEHTEVIEVVLKNSAGKYYAGVDNKGEAKFVDGIDDAVTCTLTRDNNYTHRFARLPAGTYTAQQLHEDVHAKGLAAYVRNIIQYELENSPTETPVDPDDQPNTPEIHKRIDALRDGVANPDSPHTGDDLTDLYRLYLDYKIKSLQEANGVDLLFVIDHSGSMNNTAWQGNPYRAPAVEAALNGEDGLISEFLKMNEKNQWAAVGFKGPDGADDYYWSLGNPWRPATQRSANNAGQNGSEVLSSGGESYVFTRTDASPGNNVTLDDEGPNILTNYTAGLWRAEQFLLKKDVKEDGRKKVIVFISDGIPTLHIDCPSGTLQSAGTAEGSPYYRDAYGGCPTQTLTEFGYFVNDMTKNEYVFGDNAEFYTIGFGGTMQTESGSQLLNGMLDIAYGVDGHSGHFMTISDTDYNPWNTSDIDYSTASNKLKKDLRTIMGMNETFSNIVIQDDLSAYVDLYGLTEAGTNVNNLMKAARAKVTMKVPDPNDPDTTQTITLYENGAPVNNDNAKFTRADGATKANIIQKLEYNASTKMVTAVFDPEYQAAAGTVYTLSFDVKTTEQAYTTYAASGYDKYTEGEKQGQTITGDPDTDFLGTDPANATSVNKAGFRSNDGAKVTYKHNNKDEELVYPHPVIQVAAKADIVKTDQTGAALESAKFNLYDDRYDASKTIAENNDYLIEADLQSKKPTNPAGQDAVIRSGKLTAGTYYLVETKAPDGYNSLSGPVKITVTEVNGILNMTAEIAGEPILGNKLKKTGNGSWKLSIQNSAGYELPSTGGPGTNLIYFLGFLLSALAGAGLMVRSRRKNAA